MEEEALTHARILVIPGGEADPRVSLPLTSVSFIISYIPHCNSAVKSPLLPPILQRKGSLERYRQFLGFFFPVP
jgi:hypothetical protein